MNAQIEQLLSAALDAYTKGKYPDQAASAKAALAIDSGSHRAAGFFFLAHWHMGDHDLAARFLVDFVGQHGATSLVLFCLLYSLVHLGSKPEIINNYARAYLDNLPANDGRGEFHRNIVSSLEPKERDFLRSRSVVAAATIREGFGTNGAVKSMNIKNVMKRWDLPLFHVVNAMRVRPREWYVFDDEKIYLNETLSWPQILENPRILLDPVSATVIASSAHAALINVATKRRDIGQTCVLIGGNQNLYYWLVDNLARLCTLEGRYDYRMLPVLIDDNLPQTHIESLHELGIPDGNIIRCAGDETVNCRELIVPTLMAALDVVHPSALRWLRENFCARKPDPSFPRRIFISRSRPHRRRFTNEDQVFAILEPLGFTKVTPDALGFREQNHIFQNAEIIVSPFGTCLMGLMFAPLTCAIFEFIDQKSIPVHRYNENVALQLGQHFECVITNRRKVTMNYVASEYEFEVEPDKLLAQLGPFLNYVPTS